MIGHKLNGYTIMLAAPDGRDTWAILAQANEDPRWPTGDKYVVSSINVADLPTPDHWGQGHYVPTLHAALFDYLNRITIDPQHLELALRDLRDHFTEVLHG